MLGTLGFEHLIFENPNLFRISDFLFRIFTCACQLFSEPYLVLRDAKRCLGGIFCGMALRAGCRSELRDMRDGAMNFRKRIVENQPGFQMAPMIDIVFLLLIFFIAASVYSQWESKLGIKVPTAKSAEERPRFPGEAIINIDANGKYYLNSIEFTPGRLKTVLAKLAETYPGQPVVVRADKRAPCRYLIQVIDICAQTDIGDISFATIKPSSGGGKRGGAGAAAPPPKGNGK